MSHNPREITDKKNSARSGGASSPLRPIRSAVFAGAGIGVLAGAFEVAGAFLLPLIHAECRVESFASFADLGAFFLAAIVVDGLLGLCLSLAMLGGWYCLRRLVGARGPSDKTAGAIRIILLGMMGLYLFNGWSAKILLATGRIETAAQRFGTILGSLAMLALLMRIGVHLDRAVRRGRRWMPAATWGAALVVSMLVAAPLFAHFRVTEGDSLVSVKARGGAGPNIVLVTIDTLRRDYVGCYGHPWIQTPALDRLARDGVAFEAAISQAPSTTPSHCSLMTSVYPFDHGAENGRPMNPELNTLAEAFSAGEYETAAFVSATTTRSVNTGLHKGFERYVDSLVSWSEVFGRDEFQHLTFFYLANSLQQTQIPGQVVSDRAIQWLRARDERPFFVWLHYFDPHEPYGSPTPFRGMYAGRIADGLPMAEERERYAEDITYADHCLGRFLAELRASGLYEDALIVVTADHGEAFGEQHGPVIETGHGHYLSDITQRVPLIVKLPGGAHAGTRVGTQVELVDVAPTLLALVDHPVPASFQGQSFAGELSDQFPPYTKQQAYAFNIIHVKRGEADGGRLYLRQYAARTRDWKYIARPRLDERELYDLQADPDERDDVAGGQTAAVEQLQACLRRFMNPGQGDPIDPRQGINAGLLRELQSLGYLGGDEEP